MKAIGFAALGGCRAPYMRGGDRWFRFRIPRFQEHAAAALRNFRFTAVPFFQVGVDGLVEHGGKIDRFVALGELRLSARGIDIAAGE